MSVTEAIEQRYPRGVIRSVLYEDDEARMREFMEAACEGIANPRIAEIGTYIGVSASILCDYGHVDTFDVAANSAFNRTVRVLGIPEGIVTRHVCEPGELLQLIVSLGPFDIGHIDGDHEYEAVKKDFEALKTCSAILFHDYGKLPMRGGRAQVGVNRFIEELDPACWVDMEPFAAVYPGRMTEHARR